MKGTALIWFVAVFGTGFAAEISLQDVEYLQKLQDNQRLFEGIINSTINSVLEKLAPYDPIHIDHKEIDQFGHHIEVSSVHVQGFSNAAATKISLGGFVTWTLELEMEAPLVTANIDNWQVTGNFFFGKGNVRVLLEDIKFSVVASVNPITQYVKELKLTPHIGNAEVSITGLYNDPKLSQIISSWFNHILNDFINNNEDFHYVISALVLNIVRSIL